MAEHDDVGARTGDRLTDGRRRGGTLGAWRHLAVATVAVLVVVAVVAVAAAVDLSGSAERIGAATGRSVGVVTDVRPDDGSGVGVQVRWTPPGGAERSDLMTVAGRPPDVGARTEVAFDPTDPTAAPLIPGASVLAQADRAVSALALAAVVAAVVLAALIWQLLSRRRVFRRTPRRAAVRRVRWQAGLITRSWLETESAPQRWIPVHFDPTLVGLPAPTTVLLYGDPLRDRLVGAAVPGHRPLLPSGPVRLTEPRGQRTDNASHPDATAAARGAALARPWRRLRADLPLIVPAPFLGLLWTYVDRGGFGTWLGTTALAAALGLWWAALRGADPS